MAAGRSKNAPSLDEVLDFLGLIWNVDHALQSLSKRMSSQHGITGPQRLVLRHRRARSAGALSSYGMFAQACADRPPVAGAPQLAFLGASFFGDSFFGAWPFGELKRGFTWARSASFMTPKCAQ